MQRGGERNSIARRPVLLSQSGYDYVVSRQQLRITVGDDRLALAFEQHDDKATSPVWQLVQGAPRPVMMLANVMFVQ